MNNSRPDKVHAAPARMVRVEDTAFYRFRERPAEAPSIVRGAGYRPFKRFLDILIVAVTVPLWVPVGLLVALAIKLESPSGPVVFIQMRTGKNGRRFRMFKFRTMVPNAEELKAELADRNQLKWPDFKIDDDPRITRVGRILRKTSLDEFPQLLNVLLGDMSLVGPRPTSFEAGKYSLWQSERLEVIPGMTGLWQIAGRSNLEFEERVRLDISYIKDCSLSLDLKILLLTVPAALKGV